MDDLSQHTNQTLEQLRDLQVRLNSRKRYETKIEKIVRSGLVPEGHKPVDPKPDKIINYQIARVAFYGLLKNKYIKPIFTKKTAEAVKNLLKWLILDETGKYDIRKGIFLFGDFGTGKSDILISLHEFRSFAEKEGFVNLQKDWKSINYKWMIDTATSENRGPLPEITSFRNNSVFFDDLGWDNENTMNVWGNKISVITTIIYDRHLQWKRGHKSLFTSNRLPDELNEMSGHRLEQMCNIAAWDGFNLRTNA